MATLKLEIIGKHSEKRKKEPSEKSTKHRYIS